MGKKRHQYNPQGPGLTTAALSGPFCSVKLKELVVLLLPASAGSSLTPGWSHFLGWWDSRNFLQFACFFKCLSLRLQEETLLRAASLPHSLLEAEEDSDSVHLLIICCCLTTGASSYDTSQRSFSKMTVPFSVTRTKLFLRGNPGCIGGQWGHQTSKWCFLGSSPHPQILQVTKYLHSSKSTSAIENRALITLQFIVRIACQCFRTDNYCPDWEIVWTKSTRDGTMKSKVSETFREGRCAPASFKSPGWYGSWNIFYSQYYMYLLV